MPVTKKERPQPEINAASMADIAFLLLIFFLLVTTMDIDKGITVKLPPYDPQNIMEVKVADRNVLTVLVNAKNELLVEGKYTEISQLKDIAKEFIANPRNDPTLAESPKKAVISLKTDRGTSYNTYIQVYNELRRAYNELRDEAARKLYGKPFNQLSYEQQKKIREMYPIKISEAEPEEVGEQLIH